METAYYMGVLPYMAGESYMRGNEEHNNAMSNREAAVSMLGYAISAWLMAMIAARCADVLGEKVLLHANFFICAIALILTVAVSHAESVPPLSTSAHRKNSAWTGSSQASSGGYRTPC